MIALACYETAFVIIIIIKIIIIIIIIIMMMIIIIIIIIKMALFINMMGEMVPTCIK